MSDVRMAKFETMIEDIDSELDGYADSAENTSLALIYDYNKCNEYAKAIMDKSTSSWVDEEWKTRYSSYDAFSSPKIKIDAAKEFVKYCRQSYINYAGYQFIFWALMVLTVDKSNAEEHLSLICDFAQMLKISDEEFEDVLQIVKVIYNEVGGEGEKEYIFKSKQIPKIFDPLFKLYNIQVKTE